MPATPTSRSPATSNFPFLRRRLQQIRISTGRAQHRAQRDLHAAEHQQQQPQQVVQVRPARAPERPSILAAMVVLDQGMAVVVVAAPRGPAEQVRPAALAARILAAAAAARAAGPPLQASQATGRQEARAGRHRTGPEEALAAPTGTAAQARTALEGEAAAARAPAWTTAALEALASSGQPLQAPTRDRLWGRAVAVAVAQHPPISRE